MPIPLAAAILGSAAIGGAASFFGGERQNASAQEAAREAHELNQQAYATRYQTQVEDMKAAGLNPILAATQGAPVGAAAPAAAVPSNSGRDAAASALQAARLSAEIKLLDQQADKAKAETEGVNYDNSQRAVWSKLWDRVGGIHDYVSNSARSAKRTIGNIISRSNSFSNPRSYNPVRKIVDAQGRVHRFD